MRKAYTKGLITLAEIYANTVTGVNGCIEWTGSTARNGYGQVRRQGKLVTVTRLVMHLKHAFPLESKLFVLHHCDNPRCINEKHLYIGTRKDNVRDRLLRNRGTKGTSVPCAKLNERIVREIFKESKRGMSGRAIARKIGVAQTTVNNVLKRFTWKHVEI